MIHGIEVKVEIEAHVGSNQELKAIPAQEIQVVYCIDKNQQYYL